MRNLLMIFFIGCVLNICPFAVMADDSDISFDDKTTSNTVVAKVVESVYKSRIDAAKSLDSFDRRVALVEIVGKKDFSEVDQHYLVASLQENPFDDSFDTKAILDNLLNNSKVTESTKQLIINNLSKFKLDSSDQNALQSIIDNKSHDADKGVQVTTESVNLGVLPGIKNTVSYTGSMPSYWGFLGQVMGWFIFSPLILWLVISFWILWDASNIGVRAGKVPGFPDFGPLGWFFLTLCCCCIGVPFYIAKRKRYIEANVQMPLQQSGAESVDKSIVVDNVDNKEDAWAVVAHLGGIFLYIIPSLVIWLWKGKASNFVEKNAKEALNFQLSLFIYQLCAMAVAATCIGIPIAIVAFFFFWLANVICSIQGAINSSKKTNYSYPFSLKLIH